MEPRNESGRKSADKKNAGMGNNVIWYLLALGIGTVFLVALLASKPDVEIRLLELEQLDQNGERRKECPGTEAAARTSTCAMARSERKGAAPLLAFEESHGRRPPRSPAR